MSRPEQLPTEAQRNFEAVIDALNARDFRTLADLLDPDVEFRSVIAQAEGETAYGGIQGIRKWAENIDATWEGVRTDPREAFEAVGREWELSRNA